MPQGLQVFNAAGQLVLDIGSRPLKLFTVQNLTVGVPVTVPITRPPNTDVAVSVATPPPGAGSTTPRVTVNANSVDFSWDAGFGSGSARADIFFY